MKITTLDQLENSLERVADALENIDNSLSSYVTKAEASSTYLAKTDAAATYALKNQPVTLGTAAQTAEGALWVQWN